jgi:hypothetical protein
LGTRGRPQVNRVVLTGRRPLPVYPNKQTWSELVGMSQRCQQRKSRLHELPKEKPPEGGSSIWAFGCSVNRGEPVPAIRGDLNWDHLHHARSSILARSGTSRFGSRRRTEGADAVPSTSVAMSVVGQTQTSGPIRARSRSFPNNRHEATAAASPFGANMRHRTSMSPERKDRRGRLSIQF